MICSDIDGIPHLMTRAPEYEPLYFIQDRNVSPVTKQLLLSESAITHTLGVCSPARSHTRRGGTNGQNKRLRIVTDHSLGARVYSPYASREEIDEIEYIADPWGHVGPTLTEIVEGAGGKIRLSVSQVDRSTEGIFIRVDFFDTFDALVVDGAILSRAYPVLRCAPASPYLARSRGQEMVLLPSSLSFGEIVDKVKAVVARTSDSNCLLLDSYISSPY